MKTTIKLLPVLLLGGILASCDNYLKDDSGDLLIPSRVADYQPLLYGEGYPRTFNRDVDWFALMTDDVEINYLGDDYLNPNVEMNENRAAFQWDAEMQETLADKFWAKRYANILCCNVVINNIGNIEYTESETGKYYYLIAQAYALRAYHYFCLINAYALPWSEANLDKPGVVIRLESEIKEGTFHRKRSTIGEVYELIESDLALAQEYMKKATPSLNKHLIRPIAIKFLENRIALFQQKWDEVIRTGNELLKMNNTIYNLTTVADANLGSTSSSGTFFTMFNPTINDEVIFTFGDNITYSSTLSSGSLFQYGFTTSREGATGVENDDQTTQRSLRAMYGTNDKRLTAYFSNEEGRNFYPIKYKGVVGGGYHECWRTVEVMLNMAEAYARTAEGVSADGLKLFNDLRAKRIKSYKTVTAATLTKESLLRRILSERRRELCFEECMRFWDLRRLGMPSITHKWLTTQTTYETYVLPAGSPNYVLVIPDSEFHYNNDITNNERELIPAQ